MKVISFLHGTPGQDPVSFISPKRDRKFFGPTPLCTSESEDSISSSARLYMESGNFGAESWKNKNLTAEQVDRPWLKSTLAKRVWAALPEKVCWDIWKETVSFVKKCQSIRGAACYKSGMMCAICWIDCWKEELKGKGRLHAHNRKMEKTVRGFEAPKRTSVWTVKRA